MPHPYFYLISSLFSSLLMMFTLSKHDTGNLSFMYKRDMKFNIGFESISHARHVQYNMNPVNYNMRLELSDTSRKAMKKPVSLSEHVKLGKDVFIDTSAILKIDKKNSKQLTYQKALAQELTYMLQLETVRGEEFVTLPIISSMNVVLPKRIRHEDEKSISFDSIAIYSENQSIEELKRLLEAL